MKLIPKCPFYDIEVTQIHAFLYWKEDKVLLSKIHGKTCDNCEDSLVTETLILFYKRADYTYIGRDTQVEILYNSFEKRINELSYEKMGWNCQKISKKIKNNIKGNQ